ncbi:MAG: glycosyltransferase family 39 protein [Caldilineaceae bacterium]
MKHRIPAITWLLALFFLLASSYSIVNPLFEAPDEVWHYELVRWLAEGKGLPQPADIGNAPWQQEGAQPPLYYLLGAVLTLPIPTNNAAEVIRYNPHAVVGNADAPANKNMMVHGPWEDWPWQGVVLAVHVMRLLSVLLGMVTLLFTWRTAKLIFPRSARLAWLAAALVAFNPQFLFISASVTNDTLVTACAAISLWLLLRIVRDSQTHAAPPAASTLILLGLVLGAAALSKVNGLALSGLAGLVLIVVAWRRRSFSELLHMGVLAGVVVVAVAGWWYWRNWQLFQDPLALSVLTAVLPGRDEPLSWRELLSLAPGVWRSYWGVFGWFNVDMDSWLYALYSGLSLLAGVGLVMSVRRWWGGVSGAALLLLTLWILLVTTLVVRWAQINYPQGRLLFPAIGALAILLADGLLNWAPQRIQQIVTVTTTVALLIPATAAPWRWIASTYRSPQLIADSSKIPAPETAIFGNALLLHGYALSSTEATPGSPWSLTLYWSALRPLPLDYSIFIHLTDENGVLQAQNDSFPAGGALPTRALAVGQIAPDQHRIEIPPALPANTLLEIDIGVYDYLSGQRLWVNGADQLRLGDLRINARQATDELPPAINFEDKIELIDYALDRTLVAPGESLNIALTWQAQQALATDYTVFVHLLLPPDAVWAQVDEAPLQGQAATSNWQPGQIISDSHTLTIPPQAPNGIYRLEIGLYDRQTMDRLKVNLEDAGILIGSVRVQK